MQEQRVPPQNIEAEQSVLGAMMIQKDAISNAGEVLTAQDFYREANKLIYQVILSLYEKNEAVDMITITEALKRDNKLEAVGGIAYITYLANAVPTAANVKFHANIVAEKSVLRQLINVSTNIASMGYEPTEEVENILDQAEKMIMDIASNKIGGDFQPIRKTILAVYGQIEALYGNKGAITGLSSGFKDLDRLTAGFQPSDLVLIAARPSMGKTAFVLNIAQYVGMNVKKSVAFFSLEMSKEQLVQRMLCSVGNLDSQRVKTGELDGPEWSVLIDAADKLSKTQIFIDDTAGITVMEMRAKARRLKMSQGLDLIIIDYLQLMQGSSARSKSENRQQEISDISRSLKSLARELNVPVIALSQLSRGVESRANKRPMLSDLRESGSLEQDADIVAFIYREDYYEKTPERENITEIIISKHRNGPIGSIDLFFDKKVTRFKDLSPITNN